MLEKSIAAKIVSAINKKIVWVDTETTGVNKNVDEVIQFGATVVIPNGTFVDTNILIKPSFPIPKASSEIHGIFDKDVAGKLGFESHVDEIVALFKDADVGGFNVGFDIAILDRQLTKAGKPNVFANARVYDAYRIFMRHSPRNLGAAFEYYTDKPMEDAHDALADIHTTITIAAKQIEMESDKRIDELFEKKESQYILNNNGVYVLNFGRYKGQEISKADKGYLNWVIKSDLPKEVKDIVGKFL